MSSSTILILEEQEQPVETLFRNEDEDSVEPPREEWASLTCVCKPDINLKRILYEQGLYDVGSGEICTKYIAQSDSFVFRHPYYKYPGISDPGIEDALLKTPPQTVYANDGQELYLALCKEMGICPIRLFSKQLLEETVNLRYYGVHTCGFRPIAMALKMNTFVRVLDLTDNWINDDGCYHIGEMLLYNTTIRDLDLSGCRIGPNGAERLYHNLPLNRTLRKINLSRNQLTDAGVEYLAMVVYAGANIVDVNLSCNNLTTESAKSLKWAFEIRNMFTHLDLSWNCMLMPAILNTLCAQLVENDVLEELNLSWNSMNSRFSNALQNITQIPNLKRLYLGNNKIDGDAISAISVNLKTAKKLELLDLSNNPLSPQDAIAVLKPLLLKKVKIQHLLLDNVIVTMDFMDIREKILLLKYRKDAIITHGDVRPNFVAKGPDMRDLILTRAALVCSKPKKFAVDIPLLILKLHKDHPDPISSKDLARMLKLFGAYQLSEDLVEEIVEAFRGPGKGKFKTANVVAMVDYVHRKWPDKELPPTPPAEPEPEPELKKKAVNGKKK